MNLSVKVPPKAIKNVKPLIQATFPEYSGRKVNVVFTTKVQFYDLNWDGGTHNAYAAIKADGTRPNLRGMNARAPWDNPFEGLTVDLPADLVIVCRSYFCGHDTGITIYANPVYAPKWLPEGNA